MFSLKRAFDYSIWAWTEYFSHTSTETVYNDLSTDTYDRTINYPLRVKRFATIFPHITPSPKTILDLACGTGAMIDALPWKAKARIMGIDLSEGMLQVARSRFKAYKNIHLEHGSFLSLPYKANSFELITMSYASRFVPPDQELKFFLNLKKILNPGGYLVIVTAESILEVCAGPIGTYLGIPRGSNARMNYSGYLKKHIHPYIPYQKQIFLGHEAVFFLHKALIFQKR